MSSEMYSTAPAAMGGMGVLSASLLSVSETAMSRFSPTPVYWIAGIGAGVAALTLIFCYLIAAELLVSGVVVPAGILIVIAAVVFLFGPCRLMAPVMLAFLVAFFVVGRLLQHRAKKRKDEEAGTDRAV